MTDSHPPNRLINETSPYLLQHAYNPVDWYPWGEEALQLARAQNRPIFLSIGYSACHWCHVMERESFENPHIAKLMNQWFINIKVDREERPDLDQIYMTAVQLITGHGGWPMSVFLSPEGKPFYGGTYWPPDSRPGMLGFPIILSKIHQLWEQDQDQCLSKAGELVEEIERLHHEERDHSPLNEELLRHAQHRLLQSADSQEGGFGNAPKFPHPVDLRVLLRTWQRFQEPSALKAVTLTLDKMSQGGIYDHLGGGFARYSVDRYWLVPHFEKMLYDNSQLVMAYLEGYQATGNRDYLRVIRETLDYIQREMTSPEGGFYSTQDADSEGVEGKFYVWSFDEIEKLLEPEQARAICHCYQVSPEGNWEEQNILHRKSSLSEVAAQLGLSPENLETLLFQARQKLLSARNRRIAPGRDEKIIVAWNGLMLSAFAQAGRVLEDENYLNIAIKAADFLLREFRREEGTLWHCRMKNRNQINGFLDDYACLIDGLSDLYLATLKTDYYQAALELAEILIQQFYDEETNSLNYTPNDHEELVVRVKDRYDSAIPSGSNLAIYALLRLGKISGREDFVRLAEECLKTVSGTIRIHPSGMGQAILALDLSLGPGEELVLCSGSTLVDFQNASKQILTRFLPRTILFLIKEHSDQNGSPLLDGKKSNSDQLTLYRCQAGSCEAPVTGVENILNDLSKLH